MLALVLHELKGGLRTSGLAGTEGSAEYGLFRAGAKIFDGFAGSGDEAAGAGERFGEAAADDVDFVVEAEVIHGAAAIAA